MNPEPGTNQRPQKTQNQAQQPTRGGHRPAGRGTQPQGNAGRGQAAPRGRQHDGRQAQKVASTTVARAFAHEGLNYGVGAHERNRPDSDHKANPSKGELTEGPCEAISHVVIAALEADPLAASEGSFTLGIVEATDGTMYVTQSGDVGSLLPHALKTLPALKLIVVNGGTVAFAPDSVLRKKDVRSYAHPDMNAQARGGFTSYPDKKDGSEVANGVPGSCALQKLIDHLIKIDKFPKHASERWYAPARNMITISPHENAKPQKYAHGASIPSCRTCRDVVPFQLDGIEKSIEEKPARDAKARADADAGVAEQEAQRTRDKKELDDSAAAGKHEKAVAAKRETSEIKLLWSGLCTATAFAVEQVPDDYLWDYGEIYQQFWDDVIPSILGTIPALAGEVATATTQLADAKQDPVAKRRLVTAEQKLDEAKVEARGQLLVFETIWQKIPKAAYEGGEPADWSQEKNPWLELQAAVRGEVWSDED
ncbi:MAG TPA: hypothetical protein VGM88_13995 [Kofleriaceae bacterium]|jgi:hypothetical protein